jgi:hypothetical protein
VRSRTPAGAGTRRRRPEARAPQRCEVGDPDAPDRYGVHLFGGGIALVGHGCTIHASEVAIRQENHSIVFVDDDATLDAPEDTARGLSGRVLLGGYEVQLEGNG